jgi:hypothetical protein
MDIESTERKEGMERLINEMDMEFIKMQIKDAVGEIAILAKHR